MKQEQELLAMVALPSAGQTKVCAVAAFFDLDGTLLEKPSLERRLWQALRASREIPLWNYAAWIGEVIRQWPRGRTAALQANKKYLSGVAAACLRDGKMRAGGAAIARMSGPRFFPEGVERMARHARQGHAIVLVTGTLEPLAVRAAAALRQELKVRGCDAAVHICATRLEEKNGRWTGRIRGEAMLGTAKARAVIAAAGKFGLDPAQCSAYGDSEQDRWMLGCVGHPFAVNASRGLRRVARARGWPVLEWAAEDRVRDNGVEATRLCDGDAA